MPRPSEGSYFNEKNKHRVVEDFVVSYLNRDITVMDNATVEVEPESGDPDERKYEQMYKLNRLAERTLEANRVWSYWYQDKRFAGFKGMCLKYADPSITKIQRKNLEDKLYPMITVLLTEERVRGSFKLQPYRDWELNRLSARVKAIEKNWKAFQKRGISP